MIKEVLVKEETMWDESCRSDTKCCRNLEERKTMAFELRNNLGNVTFEGRLSLRVPVSFALIRQCRPHTGDTRLSKHVDRAAFPRACSISDPARGSISEGSREVGTFFLCVTVPISIVKTLKSCKWKRSNSLPPFLSNSQRTIYFYFDFFFLFGVNANCIVL